MKYQPEFSAYHPPPVARSLRRARLFTGGTYFRTKTPSKQGNKISIELIEVAPAESAKLIVTNHNTIHAEMVTGPALVEVLEQSMTWHECYTIDNLTTVPQLHYFKDGVKTDLGPFSFSKLLHIKDKLTVMLTPKLSEITPSSVITIKPRTRVYDLQPITHTPEPTAEGAAGVPLTGWDPMALRLEVNAKDPWIEMLPRSGTPPSTDPLVPAVPLEEKFDEQDDGIDDMFLSPFEDTFMTGGDGLPDYPKTAGEGLDSFMMHVAYSEQPNGTMDSVYDMYQWVGDSPTTGEWVKY